MNPNPVNNAALKELVKDPVVYAIPFLVGSGSYLMKGSEVNATWAIGLVLIVLGGLGFVAKLSTTIIDSSFKKRYTELIDLQLKTIKDQTSTIGKLSKGTVAAHESLASREKLSGGYERVSDSTLTQAAAPLTDRE